MNKILSITIAIASLLCGCEKEPSIIEAKQTTNRKYSAVVIEFSTKGETHEYLVIDGYERCGLSHLPNCKYCNAKNNLKGENE